MKSAHMFEKRKRQEEEAFRADIHRRRVSLGKVSPDNSKSTDSSILPAIPTGKDMGPGSSRTSKVRRRMFAQDMEA
jgi:hypothetical protein